MKNLFYLLVIGLALLCSCSKNDDFEEDVVIENVMSQGKSGTCKFTFGDDGVLVVEPENGEVGELAEWTNPQDVPWAKLRSATKKVVFKKTVIARTCYFMFYMCDSLKSIDLRHLNTDKTTSMYAMFFKCSSLKNIDMSNCNTGNVTDMGWMFACCDSLKSLYLSGFKTDKVTSMYCMFNKCFALESVDTRNWNTGNVMNMSWMFDRCESLTNIDVSNFNTSKVQTMHCMFQSCKLLRSLDLKKFDTSNCRDMGWMFYGCSSLTELNLSSFNTGKVSTMQRALSNCSNLKTLDFTNIVTTSAIVTDMFKDNNSLVNIISNSETPSSLNEETFSSLPTLGSCKLTTPKGSEESYKSAKGWSRLY